MLNSTSFSKASTKQEHCAHSIQPGKKKSQRNKQIDPNNQRNVHILQSKIQQFAITVKDTFPRLLRLQERQPKDCLILMPGIVLPATTKVYYSITRSYNKLPHIFISKFLSLLINPMKLLFCFPIQFPKIIKKYERTIIISQQSLAWLLIDIIQYTSAKTVRQLLKITLFTSVTHKNNLYFQKKKIILQLYKHDKRNLNQIQHKQNNPEADL